MHRITLVTGAGHGIGKGIAARLVAEVWVAIADIDGEAAKMAAADHRQMRPSRKVLIYTRDGW